MADEKQHIPTSNKISDSALEVVQVNDAEDPVLFRKIQRKCDIRLIPILGLFFLVSFIDRTNIANARIEGLEKELHMPSNGFNTAIWIFTIPFVLLEVPANLVMSSGRVKPNIWLGILMFFLGVCSMCQGPTKSYGGLLACRFLMGVFEAGLGPGAGLLMAQYYKRNEYQVRYSMFFVFALVGNAVSSFLAYLIEKMDNKGGLSGWRWIFILEGLFTIAISITAITTLPDFPKTATFLSNKEHTILITHLEKEGLSEVSTSETEPTSWQTLTNWKVWGMTIAYIGADMGASSTVSFQPTILKQLGWSSSQAQLHAVPVYLSAVVVVLITSQLSTLTRIRYPFVIAGTCLSLIGWSIQLAQVNPAAVRYFAIFCVYIGCMVQMAILVVWLNNNLVGRRARAVGNAIMFGFGNSANLISSNVFITKEAPRYPVGFGVGLATSVLGMAATLGTVWFLRRENKRLDVRGDETVEGLETGGRFRNFL